MSDNFKAMSAFTNGDCPQWVANGLTFVSEISVTITGDHVAELVDYIH